MNAEVLGMRDKSGWHCRMIAVYKKKDGETMRGIDVLVSDENMHRRVHMFITGGEISYTNAHNQIKLARKILNESEPTQKYKSFGYEGVA